MNDFYRTRMGHTFYNKNVPELVEQLARLNDLLERLIDRLGRKDDDRDADA